jgi:hypothetical protein
MGTYIMRIGIVGPGKELTFKEVRNSLDTFKHIIGGDISQLKLPHRLMVLYDSEAEKKDRLYNRTLAGMKLFGTLIIVKDGKGKWLELSPEDVEPFGWKAGKQDEQPVIAYDGIHEPTTFKSLRQCADVFGISRKKLLDLIETGATLKDGRTTFDYPCDGSDFQH